MHWCDNHVGPVAWQTTKSCPIFRALSDMHWCDTMFVQWLGKNNKIMSMFVLFSRFFGHFKSLAFLRKWGDKPNTKTVKQGVFSQFSEVQQLSNNVRPADEPFFQTFF